MSVLASRYALKAIELICVGLWAGVLGCHRDPLPSAQEQVCESTCASLACVNPELDAQVIRDCESYCHGKFDASAEQGPACEEAFAEAMICLAELSCSAYESWLAEESDGPCPAARTSTAEACDQLYLEPHILPP
jgi:hypothetical protein